MKHLSLSVLALACALVAAGAARAQLQLIPPGGSQFNPPPPAPPPPPKIEVPAVPQMDALPAQSSVSVSPRGSFGDRISRCLDEGAAAGLNQSERATYSRACANQD